MLQKYNTLYIKCVIRPNQVLRLIMHTHDNPTIQNALYMRELALPTSYAQVQQKAAEFMQLTRTAQFVLLGNPKALKAAYNGVA